MPARDYSVMPVLLVDHDRVALARAVRTKGGSTRAGDYVDVEFGAAWATDRDGTYKVPGQWRQCVILNVVHSELHVRLSPSQNAETPPPIRCRCDEGWVCKLHPDQPLDHDGCGGAGRQCLNPECPWWKGPKPAAMDLSSERKPPS